VEVCRSPLSAAVCENMLEQFFNAHLTSADSTCPVAINVKKLGAADGSMLLPLAASLVLLVLGH
jgi:hypothetical protein